MSEHQGDESVLKSKSGDKTESAPLKLPLGNTAEDTVAENNAALTTNGSQSLLANRYELQQVLGQGGFGRTFLTLDRHRFNQPCVVKEFLPQQHGDYETEKSRELFVREAKILDRIDHPQVPKFLACFEEDRKLFIVQEYVEGQTYARLMQERREQGRTFSAPEVIQWLKDLLPVLTYLHDRQIVHRDISLDNVMRPDDSNLPMLIDFGIGRSAQVQGHSRLQIAPSTKYPAQQSIVGKIGYAPYEQIWLGQSFPSGDLYALAICAVVMLSAKYPQSIDRRLLLDEKWLSHHSISHDLGKILNRMLQDIPGNRYQSAAANLDDLERLSVEPSAATGATVPPNAAPTVIRPQVARESLTPEATAPSAPASSGVEPFHKAEATPTSADSLVSGEPATAGTISPPNPPPTVTQPQQPHDLGLTPESIAPAPGSSDAARSSADSRSSEQPAASAGAIAQPNVPPTITQPQEPAIRLTAEFKAQCERASIEYVGPIGKFLVQTTIAKNPDLAPAQLIDLLAKHISQASQAEQFRSKLHKFIDT